MSWYTIQVFEDDKRKESSVLNVYGEPFVIEHKTLFGFDLTPKKETDGKTERKTHHSLPQF